MLDCLVIDDELDIAQTVCEYFNLFDLTCQYATSYADGLALIKECNPSLILLDINLGNQSGFTLCKNIRETSQVPIIFISARSTDDDVLAALGIGGDDYVTKPFSLAVLLAKAKAVLKRSTAPAAAQTKAGTRLYFGDVSVDASAGRIERAGLPIKLKPMEWRLLLYLLENQGRVLSKDELLEQVWQDTFIGEGTLSVHIRHLREKLEQDPNKPQYIKTVWGTGYRFEDTI